jgi:hypothetical protein
LHAQGDASHPGYQGGGPIKNNQQKMVGQGGGEAQGVADPKKNKSRHLLCAQKEKIINKD